MEVYIDDVRVLSSGTVDTGGCATHDFVLAGRTDHACISSRAPCIREVHSIQYRIADGVCCVYV